jgi:hypothetical protein
MSTPADVYTYRVGKKFLFRKSLDQFVVWDFLLRLCERLNQIIE